MIDGPSAVPDQAPVPVVRTSAGDGTLSAKPAPASAASIPADPRPRTLGQWVRGYRNHLIIIGVCSVLILASILAGKDFWAKHWGDNASVLGLVVATGTFIVAKQAKDAATEARDSVFRFDAVTELSQALTIMTEIMALHRERQWPRLPERFARLRAKLISVKSPASSISKDQRIRLMAVWMQLKDIDKRIEIFVQSERPDACLPKHTHALEILKDQHDTLQELFTELRQEREQNG